ncbi:sensor of ECF-type sigma factor [Flavobacterium sp. I-SCBP12n]|uniref:Sensor of ECF-type sigma factor n=1 Tax=Flavobacterium pygoscelis TaxID=2893176 RepID=A0A9X1XRF0_9FLAO|nr:sensor of ECF-type sigma factor [Flavobacterium pygoscelis]MCK8141618.1 sensor of ECF-type sigma factor [Flavobacterium pygoscelis]
MNIRKLLSILLVLVSVSFYAQNESMKEKKEKIKVLKVAFFTTELDLTNAEAEKFWPLYNTYDDNQFELRHQKMRAFMKRMNDGSLDKLSEKEASNFLSQIEDTEEELFALRKKFTQNVKAVLPATKIIKLRKAEEDFNRKLLQQYRNKSIQK